MRDLGLKSGDNIHLLEKNSYLCNIKENNYDTHRL